MAPKILFILHLPPPIHGAAMIGQYIKQSKEINKTFECTYINLSTSKDLIDIGSKTYRKIITILKLYGTVLFALLNKRYEFCYLTINSKGLGLYKDIIIVFFLKIFGNRIVFHYHNKGIQDNQKKWLLNRLYKYQFKNARVILLSKLLYSDLQKYLGKEKVYYCFNGIPHIKDIDLDLLKLYRNTKAIPEILFLSNMMNDKGVYVLLEACKILHLKGIRFLTYFIGAWSDINEIDFNYFITLNKLGENVIYVGARYGDEKSYYFKQVDIFVHPTLNDCFPLVVLEAMQYGLPVITTDEKALPDIIEDKINGFIVPKNNPVQLAEKIEMLINNTSLRHSMGRNGHYIFQQSFTLNKFELNFKSTLEQIILDFKLDGSTHLL